MFKRRLAYAAWLLGLSGAVTACAVPLRMVTFAATPADWHALSGEWRGEYWMRGYDRHGSIAFNLVASTEEAAGDVLMISDRFGSYQGYPKAGVPSAPEPRTEILTIRFVHADGDQIVGRMNPYWDPDRRCRATASFRAAVEKDVIRGTVWSTCEDDVKVLTGEWKVERKRTGQRASSDRLQ